MVEDVRRKEGYHGGAEPSGIEYKNQDRHIYRPCVHLS